MRAAISVGPGPVWAAIRAARSEAASVAASARRPKARPSATRSGPAYRMDTPATPRCSCLTSMRDRAASSKTTITIGSRSRAAVSSSAATIMRPPSPVKHTTRRSGRASCAAMAAGSAKPMVARPLEISSSPGSSASQ